MAGRSASSLPSVTSVLSRAMLDIVILMSCSGLTSCSDLLHVIFLHTFFKYLLISLFLRKYTTGLIAEFIGSSMYMLMACNVSEEQLESLKPQSKTVVDQESYVKNAVDRGENPHSDGSISFPRSDFRICEFSDAHNVAKNNDEK